MISKIRQLVVVVAVLLSTGLPMLCSGTVNAVDVNQACTGNARSASACQDLASGKKPLFGADGVVTLLVKFLSITIGVVAVFVIIFQGIRIITSNGDPQSVNTARNGIIYALAGLAIAAIAQAIVAFVLNRLSG